MTAVIITIVGLWFLGSLVVCLSLCKAAKESDQHKEQANLRKIFGLPEPELKTPKLFMLK